MDILNVLNEFRKEWVDRNEYFEVMDDHYNIYPNDKPDDWEERYVKHFQIEATLNKLIEELKEM